MRTAVKEDRSLLRPFLNQFNLNTIDITTSVILGLAGLATVYYAGFIEKYIWAAGPWGLIVTLFALYSWYLWPQFAAAFLRRKVGVFVLTYAVTQAARWFLGDPDGPFTLFWVALFSTSLIIGILPFRRWSDSLVFWFYLGVTKGFADAIATYLLYGGLEVFGGSQALFLAYIPCSMIAAGLGSGVLGRLVGGALVRAGVSRP